MALIAAIVLLLTDGAPSVAQPGPPDAQQVAAARAAAAQLGDGRRDRSGASVIRFDAVQQRAIGVLASNGFRPDRLSVSASADRAKISGSHRLPLGRWLNASMVVRGASRGFPPVALSIGGLTLSPTPSRMMLQTVRFLLNLGGAHIPPLDRMVVGTAISNGVVTARLRLPRESTLVRQLTGASPERRAATLSAYCTLARRQTAMPSAAFVEQLHRAFGSTRAGTGGVDANRAALVALAMLVVDPKVGELAGLRSAEIARCRVPVAAVQLNGRSDLPKHWALSAALDVGTGAQLSQAMGEWKELADSVSHQSEFAVGDPSGFSFIDLAADRSGFLVADAATDDTTAASTARRMATLSEAELLPPELMTLDEGLPAAVFTQRYGTIDDARFTVVVERIDDVLKRSLFR